MNDSIIKDSKENGNIKVKDFEIGIDYVVFKIEVKLNNFNKKVDRIKEDIKLIQDRLKKDKQVFL